MTSFPSSATSLDDRARTSPSPHSIWKSKGGPPLTTSSKTEGVVIRAALTRTLASTMGCCRMVSEWSLMEEMKLLAWRVMLWLPGPWNGMEICGISQTKIYNAGIAVKPFFYVYFVLGNHIFFTGNILVTMPDTIQFNHSQPKQSGPFNTSHWRICKYNSQKNNHLCKYCKLTSRTKFLCSIQPCIHFCTNTAAVLKA